MPCPGCGCDLFAALPDFGPLFRLLEGCSAGGEVALARCFGVLGLWLLRLLVLRGLVHLLLLSAALCRRVGVHWLGQLSQLGVLPQCRLRGARVMLLERSRRDVALELLQFLYCSRKFLGHEDEVCFRLEAEGSKICEQDVLPSTTLHMTAGALEAPAETTAGTTCKACPLRCDFGPRL